MGTLRKFEAHSPGKQLGIIPKTGLFPRFPPSDSASFVGKPDLSSSAAPGGHSYTRAFSSDDGGLTLGQSAWRCADKLASDTELSKDGSAFGRALTIMQKWALRLPISPTMQSESSRYWLSPESLLCPPPDRTPLPLLRNPGAMGCSHECQVSLRAHQTKLLNKQLLFQKEEHHLLGLSSVPKEKQSKGVFLALWGLGLNNLRWVLEGE